MSTDIQIRPKSVYILNIMPLLNNLCYLQSYWHREQDIEHRYFSVGVVTQVTTRLCYQGFLGVNFFY